MFLEHVNLNSRFHPNSIGFHIKILEKSGFGEETLILESFAETPTRNSLSYATKEAATIIIAMFAPAPFLSTIIINKFYNLPSMGCSVE